jgi:hypothetical protein
MIAAKERGEGEGGGAMPRTEPLRKEGENFKDGVLQGRVSEEVRSV